MRSQQGTTRIDHGFAVCVEGEERQYVVAHGTFRRVPTDGRGPCDESPPHSVRFPENDLRPQRVVVRPLPFPQHGFPTVPNANPCRPSRETQKEIVSSCRAMRASPPRSIPS